MTVARSLSCMLACKVAGCVLWQVRSAEPGEGRRGRASVEGRARRAHRSPCHRHRPSASANASSAIRGCEEQLSGADCTQSLCSWCVTIGRRQLS
eukprot:649616-Rhodomonas_salina.1